MLFELVEAGAPHLAIGLEPLVELDERFRAQAVQTALAVWADGDQPGLAQDAQVLRYRRLAELKPFDERMHWLLAATKGVEDLPPAWLGEHFDGCAGRHLLSMLL